jgi:hypothetical protein
MKRFLSCAASGMVAALVALHSARAALPPLPPEVLKKESSHIVTGRVKAVYSYIRPTPERPAWTDRIVVVEVLIQDVEKGEGLKAGRVVYARAWEAVKRPDGWVGDGGQHSLAGPGDVVRVYMKEQKDGAMDILHPNGLQKLK